MCKLKEEPGKIIRTVALVLRDQDGLDVRTHGINIHTSLSDDEIIPAIKAASQDYLNTSDGRKVWESNSHNFNYGDFILYVSNDFCIPHGFYFDDALYIVEDDFNVVLAKPEEEDEK